jgi:hypothetical protein
VKEREARGCAVQTRFSGSFTNGGLPTRPTQAIPIDPFDIRFLLDVHLERISEGRLPEGWSSELVFGVHSPAEFFGLQGVEVPENRHHPSGRFAFTLWRCAPSETFELSLVPVAQPE